MPWSHPWARRTPTDLAVLCARAWVGGAAVLVEGSLRGCAWGWGAPQKGADVRRDLARYQDP